jgi:hypothetical protein
MSICRIQALSNLLDDLPPLLKIAEQLEFDLDVRVKELQEMKVPFTKQKILYRKISALRSSLEDVAFYINTYI